ncbi:MAG: 3-hydroxybutyryl-CoA dehydratase [Chloroflexaceae bacterium]|nr:3-hydroxybutyryl-CoA dehydratase [Chloroflexaceae bacterium]NJL33059.1 3-hydroxybutyryl-CoA dehydratase [Chloroflexaceae bacterium]NJO04933.1 3-hydroxybutyryl-CoA dehydratase [Chloroflexaceae bacterium]
MSITIENRTYDEIQIGDTASLEHTFTRRDIDIFGVLSGDVNPAHFDEAYAAGTMFKTTIAHGMLTGAFFSTLLGMQLPGPGAIYLSQSLRFRRPIYVGDVVTFTVMATEKNDEKKRVVFECQGVNQNGEAVVLGTAEVLAPTEKIRRPQVPLPEVQVVSG